MRLAQIPIPGVLLSLALAAAAGAGAAATAQSAGDGPAAAAAAIRAALETGDAAAVAAAAGRALASHPESVEVLTWVGHARRLSGDPLEAGRSYRRALTIEPDAPEALMGLASVLEATGNLAAARETYARVVALAPDVAAPRRPLARLLMRGGDHGAAAPHLAVYVAARPDDVEARYLLGMAWLLGGAPDRAVTVLDDLLADEPHYVPAAYALGVALADRPESHTRALELLERALLADWESANAAYLVGRIHAERGSDEAAAAALERALEADPHLLDARYQLALTLGRLGLTDRAREQMEAFRTLQRDLDQREAADKELEALRNELAAELSTADLESAMSVVDRMLAEFPGSAEALVHAAKVWMSAGDHQRALDAAIAARQTDPDGWEAPYLEGLLLLRTGRPREALPAARTTLARRPLFADGHALHGNILFALGDAPGAASAYLAAIDLDADNPPYWLNLATAYEAMGRGDLRADALETYRRLTTRDHPRP